MKSFIQSLPWVTVTWVHEFNAEIKWWGKIDIQLLSERHVPSWKCLRKPHIFTERTEVINEYIYQKITGGDMR